MNSDTSRIGKVETEVANIRDDLGVINQRLTKHGQEIDQLAEKQNEMSLDLAIIRKDTEAISGGVRRVEKTVEKTADKLDKLSTEKINDHYIEPLQNYRKVKDIVISILLGIMVALIFYLLFPHLGG